MTAEKERSARRALENAGLSYSGPSYEDNVVISVHSDGPTWSEKILWFAFVFDNRPVLPRPRWVVDLECDASGDRGVIAIAGVAGFLLRELHVYEFSADQRADPTYWAAGPNYESGAKPSAVLKEVVPACLETELTLATDGFDWLV